METKVQQALDVTLANWRAMSGADSEDAESTADAFEASFYQFIDTVREWVNGLNERPQTVEELLEWPMIEKIVEQLPTPLYLNFEMEAELILENKHRVDEDKYD